MKTVFRLMLVEALSFADMQCSDAASAKAAGIGAASFNPEGGAVYADYYRRPCHFPS